MCNVQVPLELPLRLPQPLGQEITQGGRPAVTGTALTVTYPTSTQTGNLTSWQAGSGSHQILSPSLVNDTHQRKDIFLAFELPTESDDDCKIGDHIHAFIFGIGYHHLNNPLKEMVMANVTVRQTQF